jgi:hypothetical protein
LYVGTVKLYKADHFATFERDYSRFVRWFVSSKLGWEEEGFSSGGSRSSESRSAEGPVAYFVSSHQFRYSPLWARRRDLNRTPNHPPRNTLPPRTARYSSSWRLRRVRQWCVFQRSSAFPDPIRRWGPWDPELMTEMGRRSVTRWSKPRGGKNRNGRERIRLGK